MSTRPDIVPADIVDELRELQDQARPEPFDRIRIVLEQELGLAIEQVFTEFDPKLIASASIDRSTLPGCRRAMRWSSRSNVPTLIARSTPIFNCSTSSPA